MRLSSRSEINSGNSFKVVSILAGLSLISVLAYLTTSHFYFRIGFPLDDAWIFQTYARNLSRFGQWVFNPGEISGGSTSPLWTSLLTIGYIFHFPTLFWTFILGGAFSWATGILGENLMRRLVPTYRPAIPWAGCLVILEWHLAWSTVSGMETIAYSFLVLLVAYVLIHPDLKYFLVGLLIGVSTWMRPDGLLLLLPAVLVGSFSTQIKFKQILINVFLILFGFLVLFLPYLLFNHSVSGAFWPTTFYAKQAEYASYLDSNYILRFGVLGFQLLVGNGIVLLPGSLILLWNSIKEKNWVPLFLVFWLLAYIGIYAWKLPAVYQHGRYIFPTIPLFTVLCFSGFWNFISLPPSKIRWIIINGWKISLILVSLSYWAQGAIIYSREVAFIESEMVDTAKWVDANLPRNSIVAAHDIGAMGFFGGHKLIDLAGLISPQVIPFLSNESSLSNYLNQQGVDYLVVFPDWYQSLGKNLDIVHSTHSVYTEKLGGENMVVFKWSK